MDAHKFVCEYRRPVADRVQKIGIWFTILQLISHLAVLSNSADRTLIPGQIDVDGLHHRGTGPPLQTNLMNLKSFSDQSQETSS
ncbi:unnamed protein product [Lota lota]